jgi:hypothetical protein
MRSAPSTLSRLLEPNYKETEPDQFGDDFQIPDWDRPPVGAAAPVLWTAGRAKG